LSGSTEKNGAERRPKSSQTAYQKPIVTARGVDYTQKTIKHRTQLQKTNQNTTLYSTQKTNQSATLYSTQEKPIKIQNYPPIAHNHPFPSKV
jgi:hypothetical protein